MYSMYKVLLLEFAEVQDLQTIVAGVKAAHQVALAAPLTPYRDAETVPGVTATDTYPNKIRFAWTGLSGKRTWKVLP